METLVCCRLTKLAFSLAYYGYLWTHKCNNGSLSSDQILTMTLILLIPLLLCSIDKVTVVFNFN